METEQWSTTFSLKVAKLGQTELETNLGSMIQGSKINTDLRGAIAGIKCSLIRTIRIFFMTVCLFSSEYSMIRHEYKF